MSCGRVFSRFIYLFFLKFKLKKLISYHFKDISFSKNVLQGFSNITFINIPDNNITIFTTGDETVE